MSGAHPHALLRPRVALPFLTIALIWGSTWFVITGQIRGVPPEWSVVFRFMLATPAMFALAFVGRGGVKMPWRTHALAVFVGLCQFAGNYSFVYQAERHLTSGIVAVMIGLMIVPNAVLGRLMLGQPISRRFALGSAVAMAGIALLLINEARATRVGGDVVTGVWLALGAMFAASLSNVIQANKTGRAAPLLTLIAWSMLYGTVFDVAIAWHFAGPPPPLPGATYWLGTAYLAFAGSVVTFPLYYGLIREIGAGRAAYHNVLVVIVAMLISTWLEGYRWTNLAIAGSALSLFGLLVALRAKSV